MRFLLLLAAASGVWIPQKSGSDAELRGVAVHDATHAWASGAGGTLLRTVDGEHWERVTVSGGEAPGGAPLDFRDVEVLDENAVVLLSAGAGGLSKIYRTVDGGATWNLFHVNPNKDGFYDAIAFWDASHGILLGDPVKGRFVVRITANSGRTWYEPKEFQMPEALPGESAFAASGTCLTVRKGGQEAWFVTGGAEVARVFHSPDRGRTWTASAAPLPAGKPTAGLFSVAFLDGLRGFVSGGDYKDVKLKAMNGARTEDGGKTWSAAPIAPSGFYSAVVPVPGTADDLVAVGPAGSAISHDAGRTWTPLDSQTPLNAVAFSDSKNGWAVGPKGTIVRYAKP